jgi:flavin-dependent dehydrogenase
MLDFDAVIVGAGPAGATAALNLAPFRRVLLIDRVAVPQWRIGESLSGAVRRLLADMHLWDDFLSDGHAPCHAFRSRWASPATEERDTLRDPDGPSWLIDRARFERRLRAVAVARGAQLLAPARLRHATHADGWRLTIDYAGDQLDVKSRLLIDAGGRGSRVLTKFGGKKQPADRLVCAWMRYAGGQISPGIVHVEAEPDGWWYAAPLSCGANVLAFHTDADLPAARALRSPALLAARAENLPMIGPLVRAASATHTAAGFCAAHGARLSQFAGLDWIATGDAAISFDPLAAQGIFNALYTGLAAAEAADRHLAGDPQALPEYADGLRAIADTYDAHLAAWYGTVRRWVDRPFWRRRHTAAAAIRRPASTAESLDHVPA